MSADVLIPRDDMKDLQEKKRVGMKNEAEQMGSFAELTFFQQFINPQSITQRSFGNVVEKKKSLFLLEQICKILGSPAVQERQDEDQKDPADDRDHQTEKGDRTEDEPEEDERDDVLEPAGFADHAKYFAKPECSGKSIPRKVDDGRFCKQSEEKRHDDTENDQAEHKSKTRTCRNHGYDRRHRRHR
eukprot:TRINITY_DN37601_c0_g1_i2.p4 TRINITY_DN37601_c0_g1~~TRINITY_DN37601_c0_g1_i2.p4  ORF type:complete len:187 (-),score=28.92 TRINITY_DN37601_c0_g1_i2:147-707(-)